MCLLRARVRTPVPSRIAIRAMAVYVRTYFMTLMIHAFVQCRVTCAECVCYASARGSGPDSPRRPWCRCVGVRSCTRGARALVSRLSGLCSLHVYVKSSLMLTSREY